MEQLHHQQATTKMTELTDSAFSQEWLQANGMQSLVTPELMKILVTQAMNVALKAQLIGINITPPGAGQPQTNMPAQPAASSVASVSEQQASAAQGQIPISPQFVAGAFTGANQ